MRDYIGQIKDRHANDLKPLREEHAYLKQAHHVERTKLNEGQENRWLTESKERSNRLNTGLRGLFDRLTGNHKTIQTQNERTAIQCAKRDQEQRDRLVIAQMKERRALQASIQKTRVRHQQDRSILAQSVSQTLKRKAKPQTHSHGRKRTRAPDLSL